MFARRDLHLEILTEVLAGPQSAYGDHMCPAVRSVVWVPGLVQPATQAEKVLGLENFEWAADVLEVDSRIGRGEMVHV